LKKCLVQAANGAIKTKGTYLAAKKNKLTLRLGSKNKAKVAVANSIARALFWMIKEKIPYKDPGPFRVNNPQKQIKNMVKKLQSLGVKVEYFTEEKIVLKTSATTLI